MRADDDGFVNKPRAIMNMIGAKDDDMKLLIAKKFVLHFEDSSIIVIKHWRIHNCIKRDRYHETAYKFEKASLYLDENNSYSFNRTDISALKTSSNNGGTEMEPDWNQSGNDPGTQVRLGKVRLGEVSKDKEDKSIYLSNEKKPSDIDWEGLAKAMLRQGKIDDAYHYAKMSEREGRPFDIEALKQQIVAY